MELLPQDLQNRLNEVAAATKGITGVTVNVAVGYGGRNEIADAVKALVSAKAKEGKSAEAIAAEVSVDEISKYLYTAGLPDPDLVIRTSGEQRLGGFLLWQSAHSEFYFCEAYWPDFRRVDFLRALRAYSQRHRRFGV
jgi:short-chain Z-isoprenyl diphosphate synthase